MTKSMPLRTAFRKRARSKNGTFFKHSRSKDGAFFQSKCDGASAAEGRAPETIRRVESALNAGRGSAERLPKGVEQFFARKLQTDLSDVCIYKGPDATDSAEALQAQAYAVGNDIVFNSGKYDPYTVPGRR